MTIIVSDIARLQLPAILWQVGLVYNCTPSFALVIASDLTRYHCVSITYAWLSLHYLVSGPAYKARTVKALRTVRGGKITIIIVVISRGISWPFIVPVGHGIAQTFSGRIIPAAAPYIKSLSYWHQCSCQIVLDRFASCISIWCRVILLLTLAYTSVREHISNTVNCLCTCIHSSCSRVKIVLGTFICILYPAGCHSTGATVEIICNIVNGLKSNCHNSIGRSGRSAGKIPLHSGGTCQPSCSHNSCLGKIADISFAVLYKTGSCNAWLSVKVIGLSAKLQPLCLHVSGWWCKVTTLSLGIGKPSSYHNTCFACEITLSALFIFHPAFRLNTGRFTKIIFLTVQGKPSFDFLAVFIVVCFSFYCTESILRGSLYISWCTMACKTGCHKHYQQQDTPKSEFFTFVLHTYLPF